MPTTPISSQQILKDVFEANKSLALRFSGGINKNQEYNDKIKSKLTSIYDAILNGKIRDKNLLAMNPELVAAIKAHPEFQATSEFEKSQRDLTRAVMDKEKAVTKTVDNLIMGTKGMYWKPTFNALGKTWENSELGREELKREVARNMMSDQEFQLFRNNEISKQAPVIERNLEKLRAELLYAQSDAAKNKYAKTGGNANQIADFTNKIKFEEEKLRALKGEARTGFQFEAAQQQSFRDLKASKVNNRFGKGKIDANARDRLLGRINKDATFMGVGTMNNGVFTPGNFSTNVLNQPIPIPTTNVPPNTTGTNAIVTDAVRRLPSFSRQRAMTKFVRY